MTCPRPVLGKQPGPGPLPVASFSSRCQCPSLFTAAHADMTPHGLILLDPGLPRPLPIGAGIAVRATCSQHTSLRPALH